VIAHRLSSYLRRSSIATRSPEEFSAVIAREQERQACALRSGLGAALDLGVARAHPYVPLSPDANLDERLG
jgi:hypothetical protein